MFGQSKNGTKLAISVICTALLTALLLIVIWLLTKNGNCDCAVPSPSEPTASPFSPTPVPTSTTAQPIQKDHFMSIELQLDSVFHIWFRANSEEKEGVIYVREKVEGEKTTTDRVMVSTTERDDKLFDFHEIALLEQGIVELSWWSGSTTVSYFYVFEPETVQENGIQIVHISPDTERSSGTEKFHLHPPLGWNNDPSGFSRTPDGVYHLFYQHYPHKQQWHGMYWGHAVSKDLVQWKHQPIMMRPEKSNWKGGIFTGSAIATKDGGLRIYYTDHNDDRHPIEYQRSILTKDFYRPIGPPRDAISHRPLELSANLTEDFRDPNVFIGPDGALFMTTSSRFADGTGGAVLLFRQNETAANGGPEGWEFKGTIHKDNRWHNAVCECSGLIPLGDPRSSYTLWAFVYSLSNSIDEDGRQLLNPIMVGKFDGTKFTPWFEQMLDFATGSYAYQGFYDPISAEPLLIGWLGNWVDYKGGQNFPTALTLPRLLRLAPSQNFLMTPPHPSIVQLREKELDTADFQSFRAVQLPKNGAVELFFEIYFWRLLIYGPIGLEMRQSGKGDDGKISLMASNDGLELILGWKNTTEHRYIERKARPTSLQIFIDVGSVEVFSDQGEWTCTARIPDEGRVDSIQLIGNSELLNAESAKMWSMKSATKMAERRKLNGF